MCVHVIVCVYRGEWVAGWVESCGCLCGWMSAVCRLGWWWGSDDARLSGVKNLHVKRLHERMGFLPWAV